MKKFTFCSLLFIILALALNTGLSGCYSFKDIGTIPDSIKTVRVQFLENRAPYVNPQLSPTLTDRLKQKIVNQTRLAQTNSNDAHYDISGYISDYSASTVGVSSQNGRAQASLNRLTVAVHIILNNQLANTTQEFDVSRTFDFDAQQTIQQVESRLLDEMVRNLTDEIFNRIFSNW